MKQQIGRPFGQVQLVLLLGAIFLIIIPLSLLETRSGAASDPLMPHFSHPGGVYEDDFLLEITAVPEATILFTLDGRVPTPDTGTIYTKPILLTQETAVAVIRARAIFLNSEPGPVVTAVYFIGLQSTLPIISLAADPTDLYDPQTGIHANPTNRGQEWERPATITYIEPDGHTGFQAPVGLRISGATSRLYPKKSWRVYFRQKYGQSRLTYPLFADGFASFKRLVIHNGGQDSSSPFGTLLRAHLLSNLAEEMGLVVSQTQPVLLFVNGHAEGIYLLRNRVDERFLADKYGIQTLPEAEAEAEWDRLVQYAETHDLNDPAHFAYIATQLDVADFIDYHILQIYAANTDWIYTNMRKFKPDSPGGRLQWIVWDVDWAFGLAPWSGPAFDMMDWFETNDRPGFAENSLLIRQLWQNPTFQQQFSARADELLATTLAADKVTAQIDVLAAELRPELAYEVGRWPSAGNWEENVAFMQDFAEERPSYLRQHLLNYFAAQPQAAAAK